MCEDPGVRTFLVAASLLVSGCGSAPLALASRVDAAEGYALSFPGPVETLAGREGHVLFRIDSMRTRDGARFEAAWFGFPEPLEAADRAELLRRVESGLTGSPPSRVVSRSRPAVGEREAVDLVLDREDGRRGFHRVFYPGPDSMLQVSVVGPAGGAWESAVPRFWESITLSRDPPPGRRQPLPSARR
jgi:hypothetical protein